MSNAVQLKIRVDDADVAKAEESLKRLENAAERTATSTDRRNSIGGRKPVESEEQKRRLAAFMANEMPASAKKAEAAIEGVQEASAGATGAFRAMPAAGAAAAAAIAIIAVAAIGAVVAMIKLAQAGWDAVKAFAAQAIEMGNLAESTGLAVQTISALTAEAEAQGRSFDVIASAANNFRENIGKAAAGSSEARAQLKLLGIDGQKAMYDVDGAFKQALATIAKAPTPIEQSRLAFAAFGSEGYKLLPFLKDMGGDVDAVIRKAEELGIVMSGPNVAAAREFNRAYEDAKKAVTAISYEFGRVLMPIVRDVLRDFNTWFNGNRATIKSWADSTGSFVKGVISALGDILRFINENPLLIRVLTGVATAGVSEVVRHNVGNFTSIGANLPPNAATPYSPAQQMPDMAALEAARAEAERLRKEREAAAKAELAAQIALYEKAGTQLASAYDKAFQQITEGFREHLNVDQYQQQWAALRGWYGEEINKLVPEWESLVQRQVMSEIQGQQQRFLAKQEFDERVKRLTDRTEAHETASSKAVAEARKRLQADYLKNEETAMRRRIELVEAGQKTEIGRREEAFRQTSIGERQLIDLINKFEMDGLEFRKRQLSEYLAKVLGDKEREAEVRHELALLEEAIAQQTLTNNERIFESEKRKREALKKLEDQYKDLKTSLEDQLEAVTRGNVPLTEYEKTLRQIQRNYTDLDPAQQQNLLNIAQQIDAVTALNKQHAEMKDFFKTTLKYAFDGDIKGLLRSFQDRLKEQMIDGLSDMLATKLLGFDPNQTNNPVAKPIVSSISTTNSILNRILVQLGGSPIASGFNPTSGGGLGAIFSGGSGPGGTPFFNPTGGGNRPSAGLPTGSIDEDGYYVVNGNEQQGGLGGILGNFKSMFGPRKNILTGKDSKAAGIMGGIGSIAAMVGGFVPGRAGKMLQYGGMGAQYGAMFGPWGAAIGAGIGALFGLFSGRDNAIKKLKEAAAAAYSITVNDRSVLTAMRDIGEAYYGKGQVGKNAMAVVGLHEVQELLRNYAASSGQSSSRLDRDRVTDEFWSGNQFKGRFGGYRELGGSVMAGRAYIVGERRPEVFVPNVSGTILPSVPNVTVNSGIDPSLIASLAESIYELKDQVAQLGVVDEGVVVKRGARAAANEIVSAASGRYNDSFSARESTARVLQYD
ncbi:MAG: hypothetical protein IPM50_02595 [Acidobacteriota bacterium]|nr:MAG: hypothetical protein IPM50_02595 [Acidobacteriota bacterium]